MRHRDHQLRCNDRAGHGGIHISDYHNEIGLVLHAYLFKFDHHPGGLLGVGSGADTQVDVRNRDTQIAEEHVRHPFVIVLAGVEQ